jgi:hypothetical protein
MPLARKSEWGLAAFMGAIILMAFPLARGCQGEASDTYAEPSAGLSETQLKAIKTGLVSEHAFPQLQKAAYFNTRALMKSKSHPSSACSTDS